MGHRVCQKTSCMGSSSWAATPARSLLQQTSMCCSFLRGMSTCSGSGSYTGCSAVVWSGVVLHGLQGNTCSTVFFSMGRRGNTIPAPGAPHPLLLVSPWCSRSSFSCIFFTLLSRSLLHSVCYPFQNVSSEAPPLRLWSSALLFVGSVGTSWISRVWHRAFLASCHRGRPCSLPADNSALKLNDPL